MPMVRAVAWPTSAVLGAAQECAAAGGGGANGTSSSATMTAMRAKRILLTVLSALAVSIALVATAPPAAAHTVAGIGASNFETVLDSVSPAVPGVRIEVIELGSRLELRNTTGEEVVVLGYQDEPYLRIGPGGVFENVRSPATYLNAARTGVRSLPPTADSSAPPSWRRAGTEPVARWHDHRTHWMADQPPLAVRRDPGRRHVIIDGWVVPLRAGSTEVEVKGRLLWVPGPSPAPWLVLAALLFAVFVAAGLLLRGRVFRAVFAAGVATAVVSDVVHTFGTAAAVETASATSASTAVVLAWLAAFASVVLFVVRGAERELEALLAGAFAGAVIAVFGGLADLSMLSRSQVPFDGPVALARACVAVSTGVGFGLVAAGVLSRRRAVAAAASGTDEPVASPA